MNLVLRTWILMIPLLFGGLPFAESSPPDSQTTIQAKELPTDRRSLTTFRREMLPLWEETFEVKTIERSLRARSVYLKTSTGYTTEKLFLHREGRSTPLATWRFTPDEKTGRWTVILVHPDGAKAFIGTNTSPVGLARTFVENQVEVMVLDQRSSVSTPEDPAKTQSHVQDLLTAATYIQRDQRSAKVILCGSGYASRWAFLAAPGVDGIVVDSGPLDTLMSDESLRRDLLARLGAVESIAALSTSGPVFFHNRGKAFPSGTMEQIYNLDTRQNVSLSEEKASPERIVQWVRSLK